MSSLDAEDFAAFYAAVHDYPPLPWQQALAEDLLNEGAWPDAVDVATGLGKTSLIDIALFAAAAGAPAARRRTFFVVDRRLVVDEAHDHARKLARALATPAGRPAIVGRMARALRQPADEGPVVEVARMRGGTTWSWRWVERPDRHAVVVGTVDQIGSRLLMRGYGLSANLAPIDAALVGTDSLILCDEAHLSQTLLTTLASAAAGEGAAGRLSGPVVVPLSATVPLKPGARVHTTTAADASHPMAGGRLRAPRRLHLVVPKATKAKAARVVPAQMAGWAHALAGSADSGRVVLTVCNTVARARAVFDQLTDLGVAAEDRVLLTGRSRPLDRDHVLATAYPRMHLDQRPHGPGRPFHVVATQTVEVGANIDADALVSESASLTALVQRLGRLGRAPEHRTGVSVFRAVVVHDPATTEDDPVYGAARNATWELLSRHAPPAERTAAAPFALEKLGPSMAASPVALRALQDQLSPDQRHALAGSAPTAPYLWQTTLEAWTNTAPRPHPDPPVAPYLHGLTTRKSDVQVLWRADITEADLQGTVGQDVLERLQALPPATEEMLPLPITALRRWAAGASPSGIADVEGTTEHREEAPTAELRVLRYRGRNDITALPLTRVQPGDVIVLPSTYGGCDAYGWAPEDTRPVTDVADLAPRRRPQIRLHPRLLDFLAPDPESAPDQTGDADPLRSVVAALLRAVAEHDPEAPPQAEDFTTALRALPQAEEPAGPATRRHRLATVLAQLADPRRLRAAPAPPDAEATPTVVLSLGSGAVSGDDDTASSSAGDAPLGLEEHQQDVARQAADFARNLGLADREVAAVWLAGRYHDEGKRDPRFQAMLHGLPTKALAGRPVLAKSRLNPADPAAYRQALRRSGYPPGMRHEALSARIAAHHLDQERYDVDRELVLHLIVAHHGRARPLIPAVRDPDPVTVAIPGTTTAVSTAELADWHQPARFEDLNTCYGPWKLALLEAVVRMADIWCSAGHPVTTTAHPRLNRTARPSPARPGPASAHTVELPALDGRDPLGFLASLGVLRMLTDHLESGVGLGFDPLRATARLHSPLGTLQQVTDTLFSVVEDIGDDQILPGMPPHWPPQTANGRGGSDPVRVAVQEFTELVRATNEQAAQWWLAVIVTDLAHDAEGRAALTPFMAPAGQQKAATFFKFPLQQIRGRPELLHQALASWRRVPGYTGEYLDHRAIRTAGDLPTGESTPAGVPGATWLATQALPLLRLTGNEATPTAALWYRIERKRIMAWPVWQQELDLPAVCALISHPALRPRLTEDAPDTVAADRDRLIPLGVVTLGAAERRPIPGSKSAGVLTPMRTRLE